MDETGLFYECMQTSTLNFKNEEINDGQLAKVRLTIVLCASMSGEKLESLIIGKASKPQCF